METPTYDDLSALPAHAPQAIPVAFEDLNGHLNIRHYLGIASEGLDESLVEVGIPTDWRKTGRAVFSAEHHLSYFHELRTGDEISVRVRVLGCSDKAVHVLVYLVDETHQRVSYVMEEIFLCIDMEQRRSTSWSDDVRERVTARAAEHDALGLPDHRSGSMSLR